MTLAGWATLIQWLDDNLPGERERFPDVSAPESRALLDTFGGITLQTWLALREHGVSYQECVDRYAYHVDTTDLESEAGLQAYADHVALLNALYGRSRTRNTDTSGGEDIARMWLEKGAASVMSTVGVGEILSLSIDQWEFIASGGTIDELSQWSQSQLQAAIDKVPETVAAWERFQAEEQAIKDAENADLQTDINKLIDMKMKMVAEQNGS